jgi:hypothetical protein
MIDYRTEPAEYKGYQQALESEQQIKRLIASIYESLEQTNQWLTEYNKDLEAMDARIVARGMPDIEKRMRTVKFLEQLAQMAYDQNRQANDLNIRLNEAVQITQSKLNN